MAFFIIRCPECRHKIPWSKDVAMPSFCPACGKRVGSDRADDDVVMPFIRSSGKTASIDKLYRDMESGSETRAALAAEAAGVPVADMSAMKMTDMRDNQREGDIAQLDREANAAEARLKQASPAAIPHFEGNGAELAGGISSGAVAINGKVVQGIHPRAGVRAVEGVQRLMGR